MVIKTKETHIDAMHTMIVYFLVSTLVTFTNKIILNQVRCGYLLTSLHGLATYLGCLLFNKSKDARPPFMSLKHQLLLAFSLMYTVNIAMSNVSLAMVPLAVHATIRSSGPAVTATVWFFIDRPRQMWTVQKVLALLLLSVGAVLVASINSQNKRTTVVDVTITGLCLTFVGALLAVIKTILTNRLCKDGRVGLGINEILIMVTPYAALQALMFGYVNNEFSLLAAAFRGGVDSYWILMVVFNGILACLLNMASFKANKTCGPTAVAIAASVKQVLLLWEPNRVLHAGLPPEIMVGTLMSAVGTLWYSLSSPRSKVIVTEEGPTKEKSQQIEKES